jgi:hypothetical protein
MGQPPLGVKGISPVRGSGSVHTGRMGTGTSGFEQGRRHLQARGLPGGNFGPEHSGIADARQLKYAC